MSSFMRRWALPQPNECGRLYLGASVVVSIPFELLSRSNVRHAFHFLPAFQSWIQILLSQESNLHYHGIMKTSVEIPDKELRDIVRFTKAKTKREAIVTAIVEYNRRKRMAELIKYSGTSETMMSWEELMKMRTMK